MTEIDQILHSNATICFEILTAQIHEWHMRTSGIAKGGTESYVLQGTSLHCASTPSFQSHSREQEQYVS